jgi:hypothetical protein
MSYQDCIDVIRKSAGDLSDDDIDSLVTELQRRQKILQATGVIADTEEAAMRAALKISEDLEAAIMLEKRNAAINAKVKLQALEFVTRNFADNPAEAVEAMLMGINRPGLGFRDSTAVRQSERLARYTGGFEADLARADLLEVFASGTLDREVARALWKLDVPGSKMDGLPEEAVALAKIIRKHQEYWRQDVNRHGGWVGKLENYIVRQSHDPMKMMRAGYDEWKAGITDRLEWGRILTDMPDKDPEEFLRAVYKGLVSGEHMKAVPTEPTGFKGPGNLAKKLSQERVLHFKSADDWFDYNEQFGTDNLRESVANSMKQAAEAVGLMRTLGTNPKAMLDNLVDTLAQRTADPVAAKALNEKRKTFDNYLANLDGSTKVPVNEMLARVGTTARVVQNTSKLGGALFSQFSDLAIMGSEVKYQGGNMLQGVAEGLKGLVGRIAGTSAEKKEVLRQIGYVADTMIRELGARYSLDNTVGGRMGRLQDTFFKWNLMRLWQDTMETTSSLWMSNNLAVKAGQSFDQLGNLSRVLQGAGIDARKWDVIRQGKQLGADGEMYLTPEAMRELPDSAIDTLLGDQVNKTRSPDRLRAAMRDELESNLRSFYVDRTSFAVLRPDPKTRAIALRGLRSGTPEGEAAMMIMQFKSFPISFVQKILGREVYGREGMERYTSIFQLMVATTIFGYMSMAAKDMLKGKEPRDPTDWKTMQAAMVQGGGMGIYGDFLFGEMRSRGGQSLVATLAGPTLGEVDRLADIWTRLRNGDDAAAASFKALLANTPFGNHFALRPAADYLFLHSLTEFLNPGALRRMEEKVSREKEQEWRVRPSENYLDPLGIAR